MRRLPGPFDDETQIVLLGKLEGGDNVLHPVDLDGERRHAALVAGGGSGACDLAVLLRAVGLGRSTAPDSLLLWTHCYKNITFHDDFFGVPAVTVSSGVQWNEVYAAAAERNLIVVGGVSPGGSVGAGGGWILGAGHSILSPTYGLGVDNVLQFDVVLASGKTVSASSSSNSDLFWALRGGGGGTFGVVTSVTYRVRPATPALGALCAVNVTSAEGYEELLTRLIRGLPNATDAGWGMYVLMSGEIPSSFANLAVNALRPNSTDMAHANATIQPLLAELASVPGATAQSFTVPYPGGFYDWYKEYETNGTQVGTPDILGSRLMSRDAHLNKARDAAKIWARTPGLGINVIAGGAVNRPDESSAGLNPAWRRAISSVSISESWADNATVAEQDAVRAMVTSQTMALGSIEPGGGYEADPGEKDWQHTFFGDHYARLKEIKLKYDPEERFVSFKGVGWENFEASGGWCRR